MRSIHLADVLKAGGVVHRHDEGVGRRERQVEADFVLRVSLWLATKPPASQKCKIYILSPIPSVMW